MDSIVSIGLQGIHEGYRRAANDAQRVVSAFTSETPEDAVGALISLEADRRLVSASSMVVRTGNQLLGSLLDIFA